MMTKKIGRLIYSDWVEMVDSLDEPDQAKAWKIILNYKIKEQLPIIPNKHLASLVHFILKRVKQNEEKYEEKCKKNKLSAEKRWESMRTHSSAYKGKKNLTNLIKNIENE